jgi:hypothetical protein
MVMPWSRFRCPTSVLKTPTRAFGAVFLQAAVPEEMLDPGKRPNKEMTE